MNNLSILLLLTVAAALESGGDALARSGLHATTPGLRILFLALAAIVLFTYGVTVNLPPWDFGKLLGVYVALFFVVAQAINYFAFNQQPNLPIFCGGALIISGGLLITFWRT
jgi:drug/metabolite transporter superfamily protein YnfA